MNADVNTLHAMVPSELAGERLDRALAILFSTYSRTRLQAWIQQQVIWLDGQVITCARKRVRVGQTITVYPKQVPIERWEAQPIPLEILYEDETLLIINKPPGLVTHPAPGHPDNTLVNALLHHCPILHALPRAGLVHRLDQDTSGLLAVAKTLSAHQSLVQQLAARTIKRQYLALVQGQLITGGRIDQPIGRHPKVRQKQAVTSIKSRPAITDYRILERFDQHTLLKVQLFTGRTHQIRVHMAYIRHPIVGDALYNAASSYSHPILTAYQASPNLMQALKHFKRQALHAHTLGLLHPSTQAFQVWEAPVPEDMQQLLHYFQTHHQSQQSTEL